MPVEFEDSEELPNSLEGKNSSGFESSAKQKIAEQLEAFADGRYTAEEMALNSHLYRSTVEGQEHEGEEVQQGSFEFTTLDEITVPEEPEQELSDIEPDREADDPPEFETFEQTVEPPVEAAESPAFDPIDVPSFDAKDISESLAFEVSTPETLIPDPVEQPEVFEDIEAALDAPVLEAEEEVEEEFDDEPQPNREDYLLEAGLSEQEADEILRDAPRNPYASKMTKGYGKGLGGTAPAAEPEDFEPNFAGLVSSTESFSESMARAMESMAEAFLRADARISRVEAVVREAIT